MMMKKNKGFIFDMDGTMIDNMQFHLKAWEKTVHDLGSDLKGEALFKQLYGMNSEILERIFGKEKFTKERLRELSYQKDAYYREIYAPYIKPINGLVEFLKECFELNVAVAVGTGGTKENIEFMLDCLNIRELINGVISQNEVSKSKPDPQTFLKAAQTLNLAANQCIVFEDVPMGIKAAQKAHMGAVVILTSHESDDFSEFDNVIRKVKDYTELNVKRLLEPNHASKTA